MVAIKYVAFDCGVASVVGELWGAAAAAAVVVAAMIQHNQCITLFSILFRWDPSK